MDEIDEDFGDELRWGEAEGYESVTETKITDQRRWSTTFEQIFKKNDGTFWRLTWEAGSTEQQDGLDPEYELRQVKPVEKTITVYVPVEKDIL